MDDLHKAFDNLKQFANNDLTQRISVLEFLLSNRDAIAVKHRLEAERVTEPLLQSALTIKQVASQIDVIVHALGIMVALPYILEKGEVIQSLSLGAGNTGKAFDLETDLRIAEFKFINWRGGAEAIRQNQLFKDLFSLASYETTKRRYLYLTGAEIPLRFLNNSNRALTSVLSKNEGVKNQFFSIYGDKYKTVSSYFHAVRHTVTVIDLTTVVPALAGEVG
jgi:hypothetical protein